VSAGYAPVLMRICDGERHCPGTGEPGDNPLYYPASIDARIRQAAAQTVPSFGTVWAAASAGAGSGADAGRDGGGGGGDR
jgi:hypothetical protein